MKKVVIVRDQKYDYIINIIVTPIYFANFVSHACASQLLISNQFRIFNKLFCGFQIVI